MNIVHFTLYKYLFCFDFNPGESIYCCKKIVEKMAWTGIFKHADQPHFISGIVYTFHSALKKKNYL